MNRKLLASNLAVVILTVAGISYTYLGVLHENPLTSQIHMRVELGETGGLFDKSDVTYRGAAIGRVLDIVPRPGGVTAEIAIDPSVRVPRNTTVVVGGLSPIGEQTLDFRPRTSAGPFLSEGDVVPESSTQTPAKFYDMVANLSSLVKQLNVADLHTVINELDAATRDAGPQMRDLITNTRTVLDGLRGALPQTRALIRDGSAGLATADALSTNLGTFSRNALALTHELRSGEPLYIKTLDQAPGALVSINTSVRSLLPATNQLIADATPGITVLADRIPAFVELLLRLPQGANATADSFHGDVLAGIGDFEPGHLCSYGTPLRPPYIPTRAQPDLTRHCTAYAPDLQQRGSYFAPSPARGSSYRRTAATVTGFPSGTQLNSTTSRTPHIASSPGYSWLALYPTGSIR